MVETVSSGMLVAAAEHLLDQTEGRVILGITGPPGAGKSTAAAALGAGLGPGRCAVVPMDGFHLPRSVIAGTPLASRRGAPDTFDAEGFADAVHRIRIAPDTDIRLPAFDHVVADPVEDAIAVPAGIRLVVVEGNYLLHPDPAWRRARELLDAVWYIDADPGLRRERLEARHRGLGRTAEDARRFVRDSDERNAEVIAATAHEADAVYLLEQSPPGAQA